MGGLITFFLGYWVGVFYLVYRSPVLGEAIAYGLAYHFLILKTYNFVLKTYNFVLDRTMFDFVLCSILSRKYNFIHYLDNIEQISTVKPLIMLVDSGRNHGKQSI